MKLRVLACDGSEGPEASPSSFLVGDRIVVEMGAAASRLDLPEQRAIRHVLLSHAHLDHVKDLPFLCENVLDGGGPIEVHATSGTLEALARHLLNGVLWPDFRKIPVEAPLLRYRELELNQENRVAELSVVPVPMNHGHEAVGLFLDSGEGCISLTGDTGPTERFWEECNRRGQLLCAVLVETSFPNSLEEVARASGHLCPRLLAGELGKLERQDLPIYVYGLKSPTRAETLVDLAALTDPRLRLLEPEQVLSF